jgi:protein TonB
VLHVLAFVGLVRAFAPDLSAAVAERATSLVSVTVSIPPPPEPEPEPEPIPSPDPSPLHTEGAAAPEAPRATPRPVATPVPRISIPRPTVVPPVAFTGTANAAGAGESGSGTGAGGEGSGTGSGRAGSGSGGMAMSPPVKIAGEINDARDYPVPLGGREIRRGQHVIIRMIVGIDGRARDCRVVQASPDPEADRITCRLAEERFRFRPAQDEEGNLVDGVFGWRQDWF